MLADRPRTVRVHDVASRTARAATAAETDALPPPLPRASAEPTAALKATLRSSGVCFEILGCGPDATRLASTLPLADGRTVVTLRDRALRETLFIWAPGAATLMPLVGTDGLLSGNRDEDAPCAATSEALFCVEATPQTPPRLVRIGLDGAKTIIDTPNQFPDSDGLLAETIAWQVSGSRASGILIRPKIPGRLPLFVTYYRCPGFVRGGMGDEYPLRAMAARGIATLCINRLPGEMTAEAGYKLGLQAVEAAIDHLADQGIVDRSRVTAAEGKTRPRMSARASAYSLSKSLAPASSAWIASIPVPADGSSTTLPAEIDAARAATKASGSGVENCWKDSPDSERRVWVGMRLASRCHMASRLWSDRFRTASAPL